MEASNAGGRRRLSPGRVAIPAAASKKLLSFLHMSQDVRTFIVDCPICQMEKSSHLQPAGRLMPLALPTRKWEHVAIEK